MDTNMTNPAAPLCPIADRYAYHVVVSSASMGAGQSFGIYQRVGVIEVDHHERPFGYVPERIVALRGVSIIGTWERCNVGTTSACAVERAKVEAANLVASMRTQRAAQAVADAGLHLMIADGKQAAS